MARLVQRPPKYLPEEWRQSNKFQYSSAEKERASAERLRDESLRLIHETEQTTVVTQSDVNKKIDQRLTDMNYWKAELERQHGESNGEIEYLLKFKVRLEKALVDTELPLRIASDCLVVREERVKIDNVHDDVEVQLLKEVEVLQGVQALLKRTLEQTVEQIRLMRSAKYYLEKDLKDKFSALKIDNKCASLNNKSLNTYFADGAVKIEANSVTPDEWQDFSDKNILKAEREKNSSINLRSIVDGVLIQSFNDLKKQCEVVDLAFENRIEETVKTKTKLETHLTKVLEEIGEMETNIGRLKQAIVDKQAPMKVAQTRSDQRTQRPNIELCRDPVQYRLISEVTEIETNVSRLQELLADAEMSLKGLIRKQLSLEEDIEVKKKSLYIDRDVCVEHRKQINHVQR